MGRPGAKYNPKNLASCVVDLGCDEQQWRAFHAASDRNRQYNRNRNLVREIEVGSIALIPRPDRGVVYCGRIVSRFELTDSPSWYDRYMVMRGDVDDETTWHAGDIGQSWRVDEFKAIPVPRIPAWIRRSLFGRSTYGVIRQDDISGDPVQVFEQLLGNDRFQPREWTLNVGEIKKRALEDLTPAAFEHLAVSLLQLEFPEESWLQVGGSGDGGVDGIGYGRDGQVSSVLQCKWQYWGEDAFLEETVWQGSAPERKRFLAVLRYTGDIRPKACEFIDADGIALLIAKHYSKLPQALSMRVGTSKVA